MDMQKAATTRAEEQWYMVKTRLLVALELSGDDPIQSRVLGALLLLVEDKIDHGNARKVSRRSEARSQESIEGSGVVPLGDGGGQRSERGGGDELRSGSDPTGGSEGGSDGDEDSG